MVSSGLAVLGDVKRTQRERHGCGDPALEHFEFVFFVVSHVSCAQALVSAVCYLLRMEAIRRMELNLETLACPLVQPLRVDAPVLGVAPEVLELEHFEALALQPSDVVSDSSRIVLIAIAEGIAHRIWYQGQRGFRGAVGLVLAVLLSLLDVPVPALEPKLQPDEDSARLVGFDGEELACDFFFGSLDLVAAVG